MNMRWQPSIKIIPHYESHPLYVQAIVNSLKKKISEIFLIRYHSVIKNSVFGFEVWDFWRVQIGFIEVQA